MQASTSLYYKRKYNFSSVLMNIGVTCIRTLYLTLGKLRHKTIPY